MAKLKALLSYSDLPTDDNTVYLVPMTYTQLTIVWRLSTSIGWLTRWSDLPNTNENRALVEQIRNDLQVWLNMSVSLDDIFNLFNQTNAELTGIRQAIEQQTQAIEGISIPDYPQIDLSALNHLTNLTRLVTIDDKLLPLTNLQHIESVSTAISSLPDYSIILDKVVDELGVSNQNATEFLQLLTDNIPLLLEDTDYLQHLNNLDELPALVNGIIGILQVLTKLVAIMDDIASLPQNSIPDGPRLSLPDTFTPSPLKCQLSARLVGQSVMAMEEIGTYGKVLFNVTGAMLNLIGAGALVHIFGNWYVSVSSLATTISQFSFNDFNEWVEKLQERRPNYHQIIYESRTVNDAVEAIKTFNASQAWGVSPGLEAADLLMANPVGIGYVFSGNTQKLQASHGGGDWYAGDCREYVSLDFISCEGQEGAAPMGWVIGLNSLIHNDGYPMSGIATSISSTGKHRIKAHLGGWYEIKIFSIHATDGTTTDEENYNPLVFETFKCDGITSTGCILGLELGWDDLPPGGEPVSLWGASFEIQTNELFNWDGEFNIKFVFSPTQIGGCE